MIARLFPLGLAVMLLAPHPSPAQGKATLAREAAEYVMRKFGKEVAEDGIETLTRRIETLVVKHGDEAFLAVRNVGPRTFRLVEEAGEHGLQSVKLMAKYGDEAVWVVAKPNRMAIFVKFGDNAAEAMMKHGEVAEPLLQAVGKPAARALNAVSSQNGRRLAMLAEDGHLAKIGRTHELFDVVAKHGDRVVDYVWKNQKCLMVAPALASFLARPEPFLDGTADISNMTAENIVQRNTELPSQIASEGTRLTSWTVVAAFAFCILGLLIAVRVWRKSRDSSVTSS